MNSILDIKVYKINNSIAVNTKVEEELNTSTTKKEFIAKNIKIFKINKTKKDDKAEIIHIFEKNKELNFDEAQKQKIELADKYKKLGIIIDNSSDNKDVLNFSKTIQNFKNLINEQKNVINSIPMYVKKDDMMSAFTKDGSENIKKISDFFDIFIDFFVNPPSKEAMELTNYATLLNKIYADFENYNARFKDLSRKNSNALASLNIEEQINKNKELFESSIDNLINFSNTTETKLNSLSDKYNDFIKNLSDKQTNELSVVSSKSNEVIKTYNNFLSKNVKSLKGGYWTLFIVNILLAFALGGLVALNLNEKKELDGVIELSKKIENINVIQEKNKLIFEFPKNVEILSDTNTKRVILE